MFGVLAAQPLGFGSRLGFVWDKLTENIRGRNAQWILARFNRDKYIIKKAYRSFQVSKH